MFRQSTEMQTRLIESYKIMLDFYGMKLVDVATGEVERSESFEDRYKNLDWSSHNYLRITRILKCLGICGLEYLKKPLIKHFLNEVLANNQIPNIIESLFKYWIPTLRCETDLVEVEEHAEKLAGKKVTRQWYNTEKRTWANVVFPDTTKNVAYPQNKTFYDRDDGLRFKESDLIDIDCPRYKRYNYSYK